MSWEADVTAAVYAAAPWSVAATHTRGAAVTPCTAILEPQQALEPAGHMARSLEGGIGIVRLLVAQVGTPRRGDTLTVGATVYTIDSIIQQDAAEVQVTVR